MNWEKMLVAAVVLTVRAVSAAAQEAQPAAADTAAATPPGWVVKSNVGLQLTQSAFNSAWAGDEVGTVSWIGTWNSEAGKRIAPWAHWHNSLLLQFGQTHQQTADREAWLAPQKSADKITYRGVVLFRFWSMLDPFVAFDVDSRFYDEAEVAGRKYFTPTRFTESAGIARVLSSTPRVRVVTRFGGALKETVDRLALVDPVTMRFGTQTTTDVGVEWFTQSRLAAKEDRTVFTSELRLFKNLATSEDDPLDRLHWPAVDVDWQNTLTNKVYKWISFDLFWQILYDEQVNATGQFNQTLGLGITYQLVGK